MCLHSLIDGKSCSVSCVGSELTFPLSITSHFPWINSTSPQMSHLHLFCIHYVIYCEYTFIIRFLTQKLAKSSLVTNSFLAVARKLSRSRLAVTPAGATSLRLTKTSSARNAGCVLPTYALSLCGLCIAHCLFEQRSGIVFVPSIMREPQSLQMAPVGFALIAFLHSG